jgi:hypothetical protein
MKMADPDKISLREEASSKNSREDLNSRADLSTAPIRDISKGMDSKLLELPLGQDLDNTIIKEVFSQAIRPNQEEEDFKVKRGKELKEFTLRELESSRDPMMEE